MEFSADAIFQNVHCCHSSCLLRCCFTTFLSMLRFTTKCLFNFHRHGFHFHHYWQRYKTLPLTSSALTSGKHGPGFGRMNHFLSNMVVMSSLGELFVWYWHMLTFRWIAHSNTVLIGITCWIHSTWSAKGWPQLVQPPKTSWNIRVQPQYRN